MADAFLRREDAKEADWDEAEFGRVWSSVSSVGEALPPDAERAAPGR